MATAATACPGSRPSRPALTYGLTLPFPGDAPVGVGKNQCVVPYGDGQWAVRGDGNTRLGGRRIRQGGVRTTVISGLPSDVSRTTVYIVQ